MTDETVKYWVPSEETLKAIAERIQEALAPPSDEALETAPATDSLRVLIRAAQLTSDARIEAYLHKRIIHVSQELTEILIKARVGALSFLEFSDLIQDRITILEACTLALALEHKRVRDAEALKNEGTTSDDS